MSCLYDSSFFPDTTVKLWNKLPAEIVSASSLSVFKRDIRGYLSNYASVGGATGHTVVCLCICVCMYVCMYVSVCRQDFSSLDEN